MKDELEHVRVVVAHLERTVDALEAALAAKDETIAVLRAARFAGDRSCGLGGGEDGAL